MKDFLNNLLRSFRMPKLINSKDRLEEAAVEFGLLPFFLNHIRGLSVQEICAPGMLFGGNYSEGCWEWKGPVIRRRTTAYGKFFNRKAGFVSLNLLPDFLNYRRMAYPVKEGSMEEMLLEIIRENDSLSSTELKRYIFGGGKRTDWRELPDNDVPLFTGKKKSLEGPLQRLQMGGWIVISDFEYKITKRGERYGWGVARYSTPEALFSDTLELGLKISPEESFNKLVSEMNRKFPFASRKSIEKLLK